MEARSLIRVPWLASLAVVAWACRREVPPSSDAGATVAPASATAHDTPDAATNPADAAVAGRLTSVKVYFADVEGRVHPELRDVQPPAVLAAALRALFGSSPSVPGLWTAVPPNSELRSVRLEDGVAHLDMNRAFAATGMSSMQERALIEQIGHTVTQFESVRAFVVQIEGKPFEGFGHIDWRKPLRPEVDALAAITVEAPAPGATVRSPFRVTGTARVFEANVSYRLERNNELVRSGFTTATAGAPERGTYELEIRAEPGEYELAVFEASAKDGKPQHVVRRRLTVAP